MEQMVRDIVFGEATKEDIDELIRLRIEFLTEDVGSVSDYEKDCVEKQLQDYFNTINDHSWKEFVKMHKRIKQISARGQTYPHR